MEDRFYILTDEEKGKEIIATKDYEEIKQKVRNKELRVDLCEWVDDEREDYDIIDTWRVWRHPKVDMILEG